MKYLVLGSEGQIGSALMEYLKKQGEEVAGFDIANDPAEDARIPNNPILEERIKDADYVFFLTFDVGGSRYLGKYQNTHDFVHNNTKIVHNVFDLLNRHNKKFIFASSQMSSMTFSNYGLLKRLGEVYTKLLDGRVVKFWNVYGLEKDLEKAHVITDLILKAKNEGKITLLTDGMESRQFLHVDDCSECLHMLSKMHDDLPQDQELHVTNFEWTPVIEIAKIISENFNNVPIEPAASSVDNVQHGQKNEPDTYILAHWKPKKDLRSGIGEIIEQMGLKQNA
jgi:nucleoside-diphosphate-sugar epimerase